MQKKKPRAPASSVFGATDLLCEILKRLSVKTLATFKLVSRGFHSVISSPSFSLLHFITHSRSPSPSGFYFHNPLTKAQSPFSTNRIPPLSYLHTIAQLTGSTLRILSSAKGVLLCRFSFQSKLSIYILTNPVTTGIHVLPFLSNGFEPDVCQSNGLLGFHMVFDSVVSQHIRVFCIKNVEPRTNVDCFSPGACVVYRYCYETGRWGEVCRFELSLSDVKVNGVYWNCGIHWIGGQSSLHYDIKANEATTRLMPRKPRGGEIRYFGESGGHLHLIQMSSLKVIKFHILELDKEKWTWFVKFRVDLRPITRVFPELVKVNKLGVITKHKFLILGVVREANEDDSALVMAIPRKVITYNLKLKVVKQLSELPGEIREDFLFIPVSSCQYAESLFPVRQRSLKYM